MNLLSKNRKIKMEELSFLLSNIYIEKDIELSVIKIQKCVRGYLLRCKRLPFLMYKIKYFLETVDFDFSSKNEDGRVNSSLDEDEIIKILIIKFGNLIKKPKIRMWYDILGYDFIYGWIPINIKTSTTITSDNTGNLAMCVYAYTDEKLDLDKSYCNGSMSKLLVEKLKDKRYNRKSKKDYYFIVFNKNEKNDIIINSVKGLMVLTPNINNLPFQVCWKKNRVFRYGNICDKIKIFVDALQKPEPSWKETFMENIRKIEL